MSGHSSEGAEPNLTPLLDMVFQLITFFMLVINFKGASMDLSLKLPVLGSARPIDRQGSLEPLLLNIDTEGRVKAYGEVVDLVPHIQKEARTLREHLKMNGTPLTADGELPVSVVLRADRDVKCHLINNVIQTCQREGYRQFSLSAMTGGAP